MGGKKSITVSYQGHYLSVENEGLFRSYHLSFPSPSSFSREFFQFTLSSAKLAHQLEVNLLDENYQKGEI